MPAPSSIGGAMPTTHAATCPRPLASALFAVAFAGLSGVAPEGIASSAEAKLVASVSVLKRAVVKVLSQPGAVEITAADIVRGYVDAASPFRIAVTSNSASGYQLVFETQGDFVGNTRVRGLGTDIQLGVGGGMVSQPAQGTGVTNVTYELGFRFGLSALGQEGFHSWPVRVTVVPM